MKKRGRKPKAYVTTWGETIPDLTRDTDGRWRIIPTGKRFFEDDERVAVARLREWIRQNSPDPVFVGADPTELSADQRKTFSTNADGLTIRGSIHDDAEVIGLELPPALLWAYVRRKLLEDPVAVAEHTGIPQLANLASMELPKPSIKLSAIIDCYRQRSTALQANRESAITALVRLIGFSKAQTLADLTTPLLIRYKEQLYQSGLSPGTIAAYVARCKYVIAHAKEWGYDTRQIDDCLSRMAVLKAPRRDAEAEPNPIDPADLKTLLQHANDFWATVLITGLNCAMYLSEVLSIRHDQVDWNKHTFLARRGKTRVRRAAVFWPVTMDLMKKVPRRGQSPYLLTSSHGTRFNPKGQWKSFDKLRRAAGLPTVTFDMLRDGGYTAAFGADTVDLKMSKVLAGHTVDGDTDKYVARKPQWVRPACDAIWQVYGDAILDGLKSRQPIPAAPAEKP